MHRQRLKSLFLIVLFLGTTLFGNATELKRTGWNLIAVCQDISRTDINMTGIDEIQNQDGKTIYTGEFAEYSNLETLEAGYAYWVKGTAGNSFESGYSNNKLTVSLRRTGWNLLGSCEDISSTDINMTNFSEMQNQDGQTIYTGANLQYSNLEKLIKGDGYWVKGEAGVIFTSKDGNSSNHQPVIDNSNFETYFKENNISQNLNNISEAFSIDLDGDGDGDIVTGTENTLLWYEQDDNGTFIEHNISSISVWSVKVKDIDKDGDQDILATSLLENRVVWYENDGNQTFLEHNVSTTLNTPWQVNSKDIDNDGDIDILLAIMGENRVVWYENDGSQNFYEHNISTTVMGASYVDSTDIDKDGDMDVFVTSTSDNRLIWYENDGNVSFTEHNISTTLNSAYSLYIKDINRDGHQDIVVSAWNRVVWYENSGQETFIEHNLTDSSYFEVGSFATDIDGDNDIDIFSSRTWYENNGTEHFKEHLLGGFTPYFNMNDIDADGDIDIVSPLYDSSSLVWRENLGKVAVHVNENQYVIDGITVTDSDGDNLHYSIVGIDADSFEINSSTGVLRFITLPDFESRVNNNRYNITLLVSDGQESVSQELVVLINDIPDVIPVLNDASFTILEHIAQNTYIGNIGMSNYGDSPLTFVLTGEGNSDFSVDNYGSIYVAEGIDINYSVQPSYALEAYALSDAGESLRVDVNITVQEVVPPRPFITIWKTDNNGTSNSNQIKISTAVNYYYDYTVDWGDGEANSSVAGDIIHTYATEGTYRVTISGTFPRIYFEDMENGYDNDKLLSVEQWGSIAWNSMSNAFYKCRNLHINATDSPDLSNVYDMFNMFLGASSMNENINDWNVSNVTSIGQMFVDATSFNQPLNKWDTSNVRFMGGLFGHATSFNQPIGDWNTSNLKYMYSMFVNASSFNQDISNWDVSHVIDMSETFLFATAFNSNLEDWNISNVKYMDRVLEETNLSTQNYDILLNSWSQLNLEDNVSFGVGNTQYTFDANESRQSLIDNFNWTITDGGLINNLLSAPTLTSDVPTQTRDNNITIEVNGEVGSTVYVNGVEVATVGSEGTVLVTLPLNSGDNNFSVTLRDAQGNESEALNLNILQDTDYGKDISLSWHGTYAWTCGTAGSTTVQLDLVQVEGLATIRGTILLFGEQSEIDGFRLSNPTYDDSGMSGGDIDVKGRFVKLNYSSTSKIVNNTLSLEIIDGKLIGTTLNGDGAYDEEGGVSSRGCSEGITHAGTISLVDYDIIAPVITLLGDNPQIIEGGVAYIELGATTDDSTIVDINSSAVNVNEVGDYTVTYDANDTAGNEAIQVIRTVRVQDTISPTPPTLTTNAPTDTNETNISIEVNGEVGSAVYVNGVEVAIVGADGRVLVTLPLNSGNNNFSITLRDDVDNESEALSFVVVRGEAQRPFITTWKTDNEGVTDDNQIKIGTNSESGTYNYSIDCDGDGVNEATGVTGDYVCTYDTAGTYTVEIGGEFPQLSFPITPYFSNNSEDSNKIISIEQWGDINWKSMQRAFYKCSYLVGSATDKPNLSNVTSMRNMFHHALLFNQNISDWNVSNITTIYGLFDTASSFNQPIGNWNVSNVIDMGRLFTEATAFNQPIGNWDMSNVSSVYGMFHNATAFNQPIGNWDISTVRQVWGLSDMFTNAIAFNQDIGDWNVSRIMEMQRMFSGAISFNQDIGHWDVSSVTRMDGMFYGSIAFNQSIENWNVSNVTNMGGGNQSYETGIFEGAISFNQDLSQWNISKVTNMKDIFKDSNLSTLNYDAILNTWSQLDLQQNVPFGAGTIKYSSDAEASRQSMIDAYGWVISDGGMEADVIAPTSPTLTTNAPTETTDTNITIEVNGEEGSAVYVNGVEVAIVGADGIVLVTLPLNSGDNSFSITLRDNAGNESGALSFVVVRVEVQRPFITTWKTDIQGYGNDQQIQIRTSNNYTYNYSIDWGDGSEESNITGDIVHTYANIGTYTVSISGNFPSIYFSSARKLLSVEQWGNIKWKSMKDAFSYCSNLNITASDVPNLSSVYDMRNMFVDATSFNSDISDWNVSNVLLMNRMFYSASAFNQDISKWDVSRVSWMDSMFSGASAFNQDIGDWNTSNVSKVNRMFQGAVNFNQNISKWNMHKVTDMGYMFSGAKAFNQDISTWDVSNVTDMYGMFTNAEVFNQDLSNWDVSNVEDMAIMFRNAKMFNQNLSRWDVSKVENMSNMFAELPLFNKDLGDWDVSSVRNMQGMFRDSLLFNQDLGDWNISNVSNMWNMFSGLTLSIENYDSLLNKWSQLSLKNNVTLIATSSQYSLEASENRQSIIDNFFWTIDDGGVYDITPPIAPILAIPTPIETKEGLITLIINGEIGTGVYVNGIEVTQIGLEGNISFEIPLNIGDNTFIITLRDSQNNESEALTLEIFNTNIAPIATEQNVTVAEDSNVSITLTGTDADGDGLTYSIVNLPSHGILSGTVPNLTYIPTVDYYGIDRFTFKVNDGMSDSLTVDVNITVTSVKQISLCASQSAYIDSRYTLGMILNTASITGSVFSKSENFVGAAFCGEFFGSTSSTDVLNELKNAFSNATNIITKNNNDGSIKVQYEMIGEHIQASELLESILEEAGVLDFTNYVDYTNEHVISDVYIDIFINYINANTVYVILAITDKTENNQDDLNNLITGGSIADTGNTNNQLDSFTYTSNSLKSDILFVMDDSGSMGEEQIAASEAIIDTLGAAMSAKGVDWKATVIGTENARDYSSHIQNSILNDINELSNQLKIGTNGGDEVGLKIAYNYLNNGDIIIRPTSKLSIVCISDEVDHTTFSDLNINNINESYFVQNNIKVNVIIPETGAYAGSPDDRSLDLAYSMASATGGEVANLRNYETGYNAMMQKIVDDSAGSASEIILSKSPIIATIKVKINGIDISSANWNYNISNNSIVFSASFIPNVGDEIEVIYIY